MYQPAHSENFSFAGYIYAHFTHQRSSSEKEKEKKKGAGGPTTTAKCTKKKNRRSLIGLLCVLIRPLALDRQLIYK